MRWRLTFEDAHDRDRRGHEEERAVLMSVINLLRDRSGAIQFRQKAASEFQNHSAVPDLDVEMTKKLDQLRRATEMRDKVAQAGEQLAPERRAEVLQKI